MTYSKTEEFEILMCECGCPGLLGSSEGWSQGCPMLGPTAPLQGMGESHCPDENALGKDQRRKGKMLLDSQEEEGKTAPQVSKVKGEGGKELLQAEE